MMGMAHQTDDGKRQNARCSFEVSGKRRSWDIPTRWTYDSHPRHNEIDSNLCEHHFLGKIGQIRERRGISSAETYQVIVRPGVKILDS